MSKQPESSKQEQSIELKERGIPVISPEGSSMLQKDSAEFEEISLSPRITSVEEPQGPPKKRSSSEIQEPSHSQSNSPADVKTETESGEKKDDPEVTGAKLKPRSSFLYSIQGFEPRPGPSSAPDVMLSPPEEPQGTEDDEVHKACQDIAEIVDRIGSKVEIFVKTLQKVSSFHPNRDTARKAMNCNPLLLTAMSRNLPDVLEEVKKSTCSVRYSSAVFKEYRHKVVDSCKGLEGLCTELQRYFEEIKEKLPPIEPEDEEVTELSKDVNTALQNLNMITENFPRKIRALEAIVIEPGDITLQQKQILQYKTPLQSQNQEQDTGLPIRDRRFIFFSVAFMVNFFVLCSLVGLVIYTNIQINHFKRMINETE